MTFTDTQFMTAKEKALVLKDWERLLKALATGDFGTTQETETGMKSSKFTKRLYNHLHLHCGHIAHFNQSGFFDAQFGTPERILDFIRTFEQCACLYPHSDYRDINHEMFVILVKYADRIFARCSGDARERDITVGKALLAKHGIAVPGL